MSLGGMQLTPAYRARLDPGFLQFYPHHFSRTDRMGYWHWSAGAYAQSFADYHVNILGPPGLAAVRTYDGNPFDALKAHTYRRNSNAVGVGLACMAGATTTDYRECPVTFAMLQRLTQETVALCENYLMPAGNWMTHAEAGDNKDFPTHNDPAAPHDAYGPETTCERWDLWQYADPVSGRLITAKVGPDGVTAPASPGMLYVPDYLRGEVILKLQKDTEKYWHEAHGKGL